MEEARAQEGGASTAVPVIAASETAKIRSLEGKQVKVRGLVMNVTKGKSGVQIVHFKGSEFTAVCFKSYLPKFKDGEPADVYKGKTIEVTGKMEIYKKLDQPQIKLREPSQVVILATEPGEVEKTDGASSKTGQPGASAAPNKSTEKKEGATGKAAPKVASKDPAAPGASGKSPEPRRGPKGKSKSTVDHRKYFKK